MGRYAPSVIILCLATILNVQLKFHKCFDLQSYLALYYHRDGTTEITPLNPLQRRILTLLKFPEAIYELPVQT